MIIARATLAATLVLLCSCATEQQLVGAMEDNLAAAGFVVRPANTPERQALLSRLPPHQFARQVEGDTVTYLYADPLVCNCLYAGSQEAYAKYQIYVQQKRLADEQAMTAQMYSYPSWNWNAWGPYGPGFGYYGW